MKKIIAAVAVLAGLAASAKTIDQIRSEYAQANSWRAQHEYVRQLTSADWRALADDYIATFATNAPAAKKQSPDPILYMSGVYVKVPAAQALAAEYDDKFPTAGLVTYKAFPKAAERALASTNAWMTALKDAHPLYIAAVRREKDGKPFDRLSIGELANLFAEECAVIDFKAKVYAFSTIEKFKAQVLQAAPRAVKLQLRREGKSFVVKDGVNPVQAAVDELTAALDAPKLAGLAAWCAKWDKTWTWTEPSWASDADFGKYKDDLFLGERALTPGDKFALCAYLGVAEYNKWVEAYNGSSEE